MAVNESRDMRTELLEGITDGSVMKLGGGMRGGVVENPNVEQLDWPTMQRVERNRPDTSTYAP